jgi:hypothetical protein
LAQTILGMQAAAPPGMLPIELDDAVAHRAEVHQASGMVSIQLRIPVAEAMAALRAYAFANSQPLTEWPPTSWRAAFASLTIKTATRKEPDS